MCYDKRHTCHPKSTRSMKRGERMDQEKLNREEQVEYYRMEVQKLISYIPWLEQQRSKQAYNTYSGDGLAEHSIAFPVYDSTLLGFVKVAKSTLLMNRNFLYTYSKYRLRTTADELAFIRKAELKDMGDLGNILSKYILTGMRKGDVWSKGVESGVFLELIVKMREIITYWDKPMRE